MLLTVEQMVEEERTAGSIDGWQPGDLVQRDGSRTVSARVYTDRDIFERELRQIFNRTWIFVAHESEIPEPDDFVARSIGLDPVLVTRDADGGIAVLLNSCSHRGSQVCAAERGRAANFRCPYHGWVYENTGELVGVLAEKLVYGDRLDKSKLGLKRARVGVFHGLIFASWNEAAGDFDDFIGPMRSYLDMVFGITAGGMEVLGPPQRWIIPANWKFGADNSTGDSYHVSVLHQSLNEMNAFLGITVDVPATAERILNVTDPDRGHGLAGFMKPPPDMPEQAYLGMAAAISGVPENLVPELAERLTPEQIYLLLRTSAGTGNVFPNFSWIRSPWNTAAGAVPQSSLSLRLWMPRAADKTEVLAWTLVHRDSPQTVKEAAREQMLRAFGISGNFEQDDAEVWMQIQQGVQGVQGGERNLLFVAEGMPDETFPGPATVYTGAITDDAQWHFYTRWRDMMEA